MVNIEDATRRQGLEKERDRQNLSLLLQKEPEYYLQCIETALAPRYSAIIAPETLIN